MDWSDTIGKRIHAVLVNKALEQKPDANIERLEESIKRTSITVGITRDSIGDVLQGELDTLILMRSLGDRSISLDFLAGILASIDLVRTGTHVSEQ